MLISSIQKSYTKYKQNFTIFSFSPPSFTSGVHLVHILSMSKNKLIYGIIWLESVRVDLLLLMYCVVICCLTSLYISGCEHNFPFFFIHNELDTILNNSNRIIYIICYIMPQILNYNKITTKKMNGCHFITWRIRFKSFMIMK